MIKAEEVRREIIRLHCQSAGPGTGSLKGDLVRDAEIQKEQVKLLESYAKERAIEFALANVYGTDCTKIEEDAFGMREVYERDYTEWITPK